MKICTLVVHDLTNDITYDAKLNKSKNCYFGVKYIYRYIGITFCTVVVHILNKDICYDYKLNESKN